MEGVRAREAACLINVNTQVDRTGKAKASGCCRQG